MVPHRRCAYDLGGNMLRRLRIENLVLIQEAELTFAPGLNAITGETGAGKTILAQAIGLLLGAKGDAGYIGAAGTEAYVEAELNLPAGLLEADELSALAEQALAPDDGEGAAGLVGSAERVLAPLEQLAPELARAGDELRDVELRLRETASELRGFLTTLEAEPGRLEQIEAGLDRIAEAKRRFRAQSYEELLARAAEARAELEAIDEGFDPAAAASEALAVAERNVARLAEELRAARHVAAPRFADEVAHELVGVGLGEGEFVTELRERDAGQSGFDEVAFLARPNSGLPFAPVAETASGGELSRIALAIAAVAGGETMVFDEIDAGIGGETAHGVADTLRRLAERAQVVTITHLPQIASVADRHFRVEKIAGDPTHTRINVLNEAERRDELQRMLGGREFLSSVQ